MPGLLWTGQDFGVEVGRWSSAPGVATCECRGGAMLRLCGPSGASEREGPYVAGPQFARLSVWLPALLWTAPGQL